MIRTFIDHWRFGTLPQAWDHAQRWLSDRLSNLERVLGVLHGAVEYPTVDVATRVRATANTAITATSFTAITGASLTVIPDVSGSYVALATFQVTCTLFAAITHYFRGGLFVNGAELSPAARAPGSATAASFAFTVSQQWVVPAVAGTSYTLDLRALTDNVGTTYSANATDTGFVLFFVPAPYLVP